VNALPNEFTRIRGLEDNGIPLPTTTSGTRQKDPRALQELIDFLNSVGITNWNGMQANGIYSGGNGDGGSASLILGTNDQARLDIMTSDGTRSTRIHGTSGVTIEPDGRRFPISPSTARSGIVAFPRLFSADFGNVASAIIDQGQVEIDGDSLRRITIEEPVFANEVSAQPAETNVTDLYFDPANNLLRISASLVQLDSGDRERYLIVVEYGDYQSTGTIMLPHSIRATLNGQPQWALRLTEIDVNSNIDPSYFQF